MPGCVLAVMVDDAFHWLILRVLRSGSHSAGSGRYAVSTMIVVLDVVTNGQGPGVEPSKLRCFGRGPSMKGAELLVVGAWWVPAFWRLQVVHTRSSTGRAS